MNLILFEPAELGRPLPSNDPRARHLLEVLRRVPGDRFDAGLVDGPIGKGTVLGLQTQGLELSFEWGAEPPPLAPLHLIIGLPRPQTVRKILLEATSLGVSSIDFVRSERGEPGYAQSTLWSSGEWRRHLLAGAEQAFCTRLPKISWGRNLGEALGNLPKEGTRITLDNYESPTRLGAPDLETPGAVFLALGSERGWSSTERDAFREHRFLFKHLGPRVLRTETAVVCACSLLLAKLGRL